MAVKKYIPYTPSRRYIVGDAFEDITTSTPERSLTKGCKRGTGRNNQGRTTSRFKGGGHKRRYRTIDWRGYDKLGVVAKVATIEYDPFRSARIALLHFVDGEKRYVLARKGCTVGIKVLCSPDAEIAPGNRKQLKDIPVGVTVYNVEFTPFTKAKIVKSAGAFATITGSADKGRILLKLPSGEVRKFDSKCRATIGQVGNEDHKNIVIGKAGRKRRLGRKPHNRGKSMNPVDHPHGGGEGGSPIGLKYPKTANGRIVAPGIKTRKKRKWSDSFIVTRRKKKKR